MEQIKKPRRQLFGNEDNHLLANVCARITKGVETGLYRNSFATFASYS